MKKYTVFLILILLVFGAQAHALNIDPTWTPQWSGNETSQDEINAAIFDIIGADDELYKSDVSGSSSVESGPLTSSYETVFGNTPTDPSEATISYTGGDYVSSAYLLVKDGNQEPAWYLFDLINSWDGMETLYLSGFWPNQGAISHVSLYGARSVPEPATMLLLGSGLILMAGFGRKRFKT